MGGGKKGKKGGGGHHVVKKQRYQEASMPVKHVTVVEEDGDLVKTSVAWNGVRGLYNLGNTCFFNSIMQNMVQTIPLRTHLVPRDPMIPTEVANRGKASEGSVSAALRSTMIQMWLSASGKAYDPSPLFGAIEQKVARFRRRQQQDAHELLRFLLDAVDTEILDFLTKYKKNYLGKPLAMASTISAAASTQPSSSATPSNKDATTASNSSSNPAPTLSTSSEQKSSPSPTSQSPSDRSSQLESSEAKSQPSLASGPVFTLDFFVERNKGNLIPNEAYNILPYEENIKSGLITFMESIFGGRIESTLMCHACGTCSSTYETFMDLSLPIPARFLDEKLKRALGLIPDPKSAASNRKADRQAQRAANRAGTNSFNELSNDTQGEDALEDDDTEETVTYKQDYECETLSSMGGGSSMPTGRKKNKQNQKQDRSEPAAPPPQTLEQIKMAKRLELQAKIVAAAKAAGATKKPKKPLNKKDKKRLKRKTEAESHTLPEIEDIESLAGMTEEEITALALSLDIDTSEGDSSTATTSTTPSTSEVVAELNNTATESASSATTTDPAVSEEPKESNKDIFNKDMPTSESTEEPKAIEVPIVLEEVSLAPTESTLPETPAATTEVPAALGEIPSEKPGLPTSEASVPQQTESTLQQEPERTLESRTEEKAQTKEDLPSTSTPSSTAPSDQHSAGDPSPTQTDSTSAIARMTTTTTTTTITSQEQSTVTESPITPTDSSEKKAQTSVPVLNPSLKHDIRSIPRPSGVTIDACLYEFTEPEILSGSNAFGCYECTKRAWIKQGKDLTPLILQYGPSTEQQQQLPRSSLRDSSSSTSSATEETSTSPSASDSLAASGPEAGDDSSAHQELPNDSNENSSVAPNDGSEDEAAETDDKTENEPEQPKEKQPESHALNPSEGDSNTTLSNMENPKDKSSPIAASGDTGEKDDSVVLKNSATFPSLAPSNSTSKSVNLENKTSSTTLAPSAATKPENVPTKGASNPLKESTSKKGISLVRSTATKQILIDEVPNILTLHLKRFWQTLQGSTKIDLKVEFPVILDIAPYLSRSVRKRYSSQDEATSDTGGETASPASKARKVKRNLNTQSVRYQLYGIVVHSGSMSGGHYVAYTRRRENPISDTASLEDIRSGWHYYSDTSSSPSSLENVLSQQAYILFYERVID